MDDIHAREVGLHLYRLTRLHREGGHRDTSRRDNAHILSEAERRLHEDLILLGPDAQATVQFLLRRVTMPTISISTIPNSLFNVFISFSFLY